jgi:hypothetical protein
MKLTPGQQVEAVWPTLSMLNILSCFSAATWSRRIDTSLDCALQWQVVLPAQGTVGNTPPGTSPSCLRYALLSPGAGGGG